MAAAICCFHWTCLIGTLQAADLTAKDLKALYLFNFAKFTKWGGTQKDKTAGPITIGILGTIQFNDRLALIDGKRFGKKSVLVKTFHSLDQARRECQILFIGDTPLGLSDILDTLRGSSILTVSEQKNFARRGGMVELYLEGNIQGKQRLVFDVNLSTLKEEDLSLNSRVLKLANKRIR